MEPSSPCSRAAPGALRLARMPIERALVMLRSLLPFQNGCPGYDPSGSLGTELVRGMEQLPFHWTKLDNWSHGLDCPEFLGPAVSRIHPKRGGHQTVGPDVEGEGFARPGHPGGRTSLGKGLRVPSGEANPETTAAWRWPHTLSKELDGMIVRQYFQPDAPDPVLPEDLVLSLARRSVPGARTVTAVDESGGEARAYMVDGDVVVKTQRPQQLRTWTSLAKEVRFLEALASADPTLPVPHVVGYGKEEGIDLGEGGRVTVEYTVMTRIPGDAAVRAGVPKAARPETLRALGRVIRRIHAIPQAALRQSGLFPEEYTPTDLRASLAAGIEGFAGTLREHGRDWPLDLSPERLTQAVSARVPDSTPAVALHTNPGPTHTFVDPADGRFLGLIDFGDAYIGHPVFDLWQWGAPEDRSWVIAGYREAGDLDAAFESMLWVGEVRADLIAVVRDRPYQAEALSHLRSLVSLW